MSEGSLKKVETLHPHEVVLVTAQYEQDDRIIVKGKPGTQFIPWFFKGVACDDCTITVDEREVLTITPPKGTFPDSLSAAPPFWRRMSELTPIITK